MGKQQSNYTLIIGGALDHGTWDCNILQNSSSRHLLNDGLRAAGLALDELGHHADGALHRVWPPGDADLPRHALGEVLQVGEAARLKNPC